MNNLNNNYLNFDDEIDDIEDTSIYRILSVARLFEIFTLNQNALLKPKMWDDPFERILEKIIFKTQDGELAGNTLHKNVYGQCWSTTAVSDALWQIYAKNKDGVRIKTTIKKLYESVLKSDLTNPRYFCYIGKVIYKKKSIEITDILKKIDYFENNGSGWIEALLYKRKAFNHEKEIRLMYLESKDTLAIADVRKYQFNPKEYIDNILFDPRMNDYLYDIYKEKLLSYGFPGKNINKSVLYNPPEEIVVKL